MLMKAYQIWANLEIKSANANLVRALSSTTITSASRALAAPSLRIAWAVVYRTAKWDEDRHAHAARSLTSHMWEPLHDSTYQFDFDNKQTAPPCPEKNEMTDK